MRLWDPARDVPQQGHFFARKGGDTPAWSLIRKPSCVRSIHSEREGRAKETVPCHVLSCERSPSQKASVVRSRRQRCACEGCASMHVVGASQQADSRISSVCSQGPAEWWLHLSQLPRKWPGHQTQTKAQCRDSFEEKGRASS